MHKRQDGIPSAGFFRLFLLMIATLMLVGCRPEIDAVKTESATPSPTSTSKPSRVNTAAATSTPARPDPTQALPTATVDCLVSGGDLQNGTLFSEHLKADLNYKIYLPPCYSAITTRRYPVIYLLHGFSYNNEQWLGLGLVEKMDTLIAEGSLPPFIIVLPEEEKFDPPQTSEFPAALIKELIPWVDAHYRTHPEKPMRAIGGLSRGAAWAVRIGFEYYEFFDSVGAHSLPVFEADGAKINTWLTQLPKEALPVFFIDIGRDDQEWKIAQTFADQLDAHHIPHEWYLFTNGHTEEYWSKHLELYLGWYARNW